MLPGFKSIRVILMGYNHIAALVKDNLTANIASEIRVVTMTA